MLPLEGEMTDHDIEDHTDELARRCQDGDRGAFNNLVLQEQHRVYQLAYRITRSREELDDLVQEIFLQVYRKIGGFRFESRFSTWLTRIAVNECLKIRKKQKLRSFLFDTDLDSEDLPGGGSTSSVLRILREEEQHQALRDAVERLPEAAGIEDWAFPPYRDHEYPWSRLDAL